MQPGSKKLGQAIGLYTSPHLRFVRERIQINNTPLSEEKFARYFFEVWDRLEASAKAGGHEPASKPVYFRFLTLMALHTYMSEKVDTAVIECGIGGAYDSTNIITQPLVTGITNLAIDHVGLLGETIDQIAWHKAGIMKKGTKCFTVPQREAAMKVLQQRAQEQGVELAVVPVHPELEAGTVQLGLSGSFQKENASLAIAMAQHVLAKRGVSVDDTNFLSHEFERGLKEVKWGGRCETRNEPGITWYIDGAHTAESMKLVAAWFAEQLESTNKRGNRQRQDKRILIFNQQTRDGDALITALYYTLSATMASKNSPVFTHAIFCPNITCKSATWRTNSHFSSTAKSLSPTRQTFSPDLVAKNSNPDDLRDFSVQRALAQRWQELDPSADVRVIESVEEAVDIARAVAGKTEANQTGGDMHEGENIAEGQTVPVLVTGSLHLVGAFLEVLES